MGDKRDFLDVTDFSREELNHLLELAVQMRKSGDQTMIRFGAGSLWMMLLLLMTSIVPGGTLEATYASGAEVPLTIEGFTAAGEDVALSLEYRPLEGTHLMLVNNTSAGFIEITLTKRQRQFAGIYPHGHQHIFSG